MLTWVDEGSALAAARACFRTWPTCALFALLAGCGTSSGNPVDGDDPPDRGHGQGTGGTNNPVTDEDAYFGCEAKPSDLDSVDEVAPLGFAARDVLAFAEGEHRTSIDWQPVAAASYGPETGPHTLNLRIAYAGGDVRYVTYAEKGNAHGDDGPEPAIASDAIGGAPCEGLAEVEIEVDVELVSDGGALDERAKGTLRASSRNWTVLWIDLEYEELGGAFAITETRPEGLELVQMGLSLVLSPLGVRGEFGGVLELRGADAVSAVAGGGRFALIGDAADCGEGGLSVGLDEALGQVAGQDVLDALAALPQQRGTWRDGSGSGIDFEFVHDGQAVCASAGQSGTSGQLLLYGQLRARSADERLAAEWPVRVEATLNAEGELGEVSVSLASKLEMITGEELAQAYGVAEPALAGFDEWQVAMELRVTPAATEPGASFRLVVNGLKYAECAQDRDPAPTPPDDPGSSGGSSAGCRGADVIEIESLEF